MTAEEMREEAAKILDNQAQLWRNTLTGEALSESAAEDIETRACEMEELADSIRRLPIEKEEEVWGYA